MENKAKRVLINRQKIPEMLQNLSEQNCLSQNSKDFTVVRNPCTFTTSHPNSITATLKQFPPTGFMPSIFRSQHRPLIRFATASHAYVFQGETDGYYTMG